MTKCIDCLQLEAELNRKNERIKELEKVLEKLVLIFSESQDEWHYNLNSDQMTVLDAAEAALARETDNEILLERQRGACGGN